MKGDSRSLDYSPNGFWKLTFEVISLGPLSLFAKCRNYWLGYLHVLHPKQRGVAGSALNQIPLARISQKRK